MRALALVACVSLAVLGLTTSCVSFGHKTLRQGQTYDLDCSTPRGRAYVRMDGDGFVSLTYDMNNGHSLEVVCSDGSTTVGEIVVADGGKKVNVTKGDGTRLVHNTLILQAGRRIQHKDEDGDGLVDCRGTGTPSGTVWEPARVVFGTAGPRIDAQAASPAHGIEQPGGLRGLRFIEGDDPVEECPHRGDLSGRDRSAEDLEPGRHWRDEQLASLRPSDQLAGLRRTHDDALDQVVGIEADHSLRQCLRSSRTSTR